MSASGRPRVEPAESARLGLLGSRDVAQVLAELHPEELLPALVEHAGAEGGHQIGNYVGIFVAELGFVDERKLGAARNRRLLKDFDARRVTAAFDVADLTILPAVLDMARSRWYPGSLEAGVTMRAGQFIRSRREALGLRQIHFGELVGCSDALVSAWERDQNTPTAERLDAIASALCLSDEEARELLRLAATEPERTTEAA